jgi:hypothetical protein
MSKPIAAYSKFCLKGNVYIWIDFPNLHFQLTYMFSYYCYDNVSIAWNKCVN